jgi:hypothetical protein
VPGVRPVATRRRNAKLHHNARLKDIDNRYPRGLDQSLLTQLVTSP